MRYTVTSDYAATGEGHTIMILYCFAQDSEQALNLFRTQIPNGDWYVLGAQIVEGFEFESNIARALVTPLARQQLEDTGCNLNYSAVLHYNYS